MNEEQMKYVANLISQDIEKDKEIEELNDLLHKANDEVISYTDRCLILQERIDKTISYIEKHTNKEVEYLDIIEVKELKNILEGDDKE